MNMKDIARIFTLFLFIILTSTNISSQNKENPWAVSIGTNIIDIRTPNDLTGFLKDYINGSTEDLNTSSLISRITISKYLKGGFSLQLAGSLNEIKKGYGFSKGDTETDDSFLAIDAKVKYDLNNFLGQTGWFDPFVLLGGGYAKIGDEETGKFAAGWGFNTWLNDNIGLSFQSDYNHDFKQTGNDYFQHSVGIVIKFGGRDTDGDGTYDKFDACPEVFGLAKYKGCPDSDSDGIIDSKDDCPNIAGLATLNGCPDTDEDGILDKDDACPNIKGTKANKGCPDTDGDGLVDKNDDCPEIPGSIENKGCPLPDESNELEKLPEEFIVVAEKVLMNIESIYFDLNSSYLNHEAIFGLNKVVKTMRKYPNLIVKFSSHTDSRASDKYNLWLSKRRAKRTVNYIISKGISSNRISGKGFGETQLINKCSNNIKCSDAEHQVNRRTEIVIVNPEVIN